MSWNLVDQSLCHIKGISPELEVVLRNQGVSSPMGLLTYQCDRFSGRTVKHMASSIKLYCKCTSLDLVDGVIGMFPCGHRIRVLHDRFEKALFLDIETDGLNSSSEIVCIGTSMNGNEHVYVAGKDIYDFLDVWSRAELLVTFNGKRFDVPMILKLFKLSRVPAHIDLMEESRHYGLVGGLKAIEKILSFQRLEVECANGVDATCAWKEFAMNGNNSALERLLRYNIEDVQSLIGLYRYLLRLSIENRNFAL